MTRLINKKPFGAAGLPFTRGSVRDFALGCFLGALMMAGIFLLEFALGYVRVASADLGLADVAWTLASSGFLFAIAALGEELLFRGYPFQSLMQGVTFLPAALGTSLLFAAAHLRNPGISTLGIVNISLAGLWLSFAYLKTRTLWLPFGLHFSWNFCQTTVFSLPTSGLRMEGRMLFSVIQQGPDWVTGGSFGPEGGVLATIAIVLCTGHLLKSSLYRRQQGVITLDSMEDLLPAGEREGGAA
jgi:membrane protease YdiL (CAAX protease family)